MNRAVPYGNNLIQSTKSQSDLTMWMNIVYIPKDRMQQY